MKTIHRLAGFGFRFCFSGLIACAAMAMTIASTATAANQKANTSFS